MTKLPVLLVAAALFTAACGATTISSSPVKSVSNSGDVRVGAGANAGTDLAAGTEDSPRNPTPRKGPGAPVQQAQPPTTNTTEPSTTIHDRCTDGVGATGFGSGAGISGKQTMMPGCMPQ